MEHHARPCVRGEQTRQQEQPILLRPRHHRLRCAKGAAVVVMAVVLMGLLLAKNANLMLCLRSRV